MTQRLINLLKLKITIVIDVIIIQLTKKPTVLACIKIKCKDTFGNDITCLRIMQSSQKVLLVEPKEE